MKPVLVIAAVIGTLVGGSALGADIPLKAPAAAPVASWTNCHIGGFAGLKHTDTIHGWTLGPNAFVPTGIQDGPNFTASGAYTGGTVGCDYQFASPFVFGVEGDIGWSNLHRTVAQFPNPPFNPLFGLTLDERWLATARARLGYVTGGPAGQGLLYVTGGGAWTDLRTRLALTANPGGTNCIFFGSATPFPCSQSSSVSRSGWTVGGGYEAAFAQNWSFKVEYLFVDFGTTRFFGPATQVGADMDLRLREHVVKLGVNYRINWGRY